MSTVDATAACAAVAGYRLATAEIIYHLPDHPSLLQTFIWQHLDLAPDYPELRKFLCSGRPTWMAVCTACAVSPALVHRAATPVVWASGSFIERSAPASRWPSEGPGTPRPHPLAAGPRARRSRCRARGRHDTAAARLPDSRPPLCHALGRARSCRPPRRPRHLRRGEAAPGPGRRRGRPYPAPADAHRPRRRPVSSAPPQARPCAIRFDLIGLAPWRWPCHIRDIWRPLSHVESGPEAAMASSPAKSALSCVKDNIPLKVVMPSPPHPATPRPGARSGSPPRPWRAATACPRPRPRPACASRSWCG